MEQHEAMKRKKTLMALGIYGGILLFLLLITNLDYFNSCITMIAMLFRPVLIGLVLAYLCNPFFRFYERRLFGKISQQGFRRGLSLLFTYATLVGIIAFLFILIVPQLIDSVTDFIDQSDDFLIKLGAMVNSFIDKVNAYLPKTPEGLGLIKPLNSDTVNATIHDLFESIRFDSDLILKLINTNNLSAVFKMAEGFVDLISDTLFGLFISLYLLSSKEKRYAQIMRWRRATFSDKVNEVITRVCTTADRSFGGFLKGKIFDSCIVGILVYFAISLIGVPYATLIAVIIAITDIVPVIGPFIGVIPSAVIILLTDPSKVIPFIICILVVQQIDGNILAPRILGEHTGVSSLCVMIAITTLGALWGLAGMVLGVPLFATVLELTSDYLNSRLQSKGLADANEIYYSTTEQIPRRKKSLFDRLHQCLHPQKQNALPCGSGSLCDREREVLACFELAQKANLFSKGTQAQKQENETPEKPFSEQEKNTDNEGDCCADNKDDPNVT